MQFQFLYFHLLSPAVLAGWPAERQDPRGAFPTDTCYGTSHVASPDLSFPPRTIITVAATDARHYMYTVTFNPYVHCSSLDGSAQGGKGLSSEKRDGLWLSPPTTQHPLSLGHRRHQASLQQVSSSGVALLCPSALSSPHPSHWPSVQGGIEQGPAHLLDWGGRGGSCGIVLPPFHETLKGLPPDPHWLCVGAGISRILLPTPLWETPSLPPLSFIEFNLRIKSSPGAFRARSQPRKERAFQCLEPKGKY